ncbi:sulfurtransferase [Paucibacter sp. PLA-PC-4]|uniref:sulfurtransferase n=1 Tax=Paucibacter sp. PLA-PC-4 TaxID=2993655 RepID=UPI0022488FF8|nr:sulfurtransferase [Paucibacter sp. PLA-PC-4]MCX2861122.1 sulfurtransferase [Paucibacter sp. PLA-PC-4]
MSYHTLVSALQLQALLAQAERPVLLLDLSFDLADTVAGERAYAQGHLPGAHYLHLDRDLSAAKTGNNGRHPLPERQAFADRLAALGLRHDSQVVCYDAQGGMYAARAWWMLQWLGHADVAVLDGGLQAWLASAGALSTQLPAQRAGDFRPAAPLVHVLDADRLHASLGRVRLIDARAGERFRGEVEPLDAKAGHIPGASNRLFKSNLGPDGLFLPAEQLRREFSALLAPFAPAQTVHQCGSGVTACHNLLAMAHAGLAGSALYPGSWSEWSSDSRRPVALG